MARPCFFASYRAVSASLNSDVPVDPGTLIAAPIDIDGELTVRAPSRIGWATASVMRAQRAATCALSARSTRTMNSSPLIRATRSSGRTLRRSRSAMTVMTRSPAEWPRVSLTVLR